MRHFDLVRLFASPEGRISRAPFWAGSLIVLAIELVVRFAIGIPLATTPTDPLSLRAASFVIELALLYPSAMVIVKRLHDRGWSGLLSGWLLIPYVVLLIANLMGMGGDPDRMGPFETILILALAIIMLTFIVELGFRRGTVGANQYGPDPLEH